MQKSATVEWGTPQTLFDELNEEFQFQFDVAASAENAKVFPYFDKNVDGLKQDWDYKRIWCNPPYGRVIRDWVKKADEAAGSTIVMLVPARTDTKWFHEYVYGKTEVRFIKGRLKFEGAKNSAPFPSMIIIWKPKDEDLS